MSTCPLCGARVMYAGLSEIECANLSCQNGTNGYVSRKAYDEAVLRPWNPSLALAPVPNLLNRLRTSADPMNTSINGHWLCRACHGTCSYAGAPCKRCNMRGYERAFTTHPPALYPPAAYATITPIHSEAT